MKLFDLEDNIYEKYRAEIDELFSYYNDVVRYLSAYNLSAEDIEDATQDTFIEALVYIEKLRDVTKMKYWLQKIAKRKALRYIAKSKKASIYECSFEDYITAAEANFAFSSAKQVDDFIQNESRRKLQALVRKLNIKEQKVLIMYYAYGYKLKEIAEIMGESQTNIRTISKRSKDKLREMIEKGELGLGF